MQDDIKKLESGDAPKRHFGWLWTVLAIILAGTTCALVLINLLSSALPDWLPYVMAASVVATMVLLWKFGSGKKWIKASICMFCGLSIVLLIGWSVFSPYWNSAAIRSGGVMAGPYDEPQTAEQAQEDLDRAYAYLRRYHPAFLNEEPEQIRAAYEQIRQELSERDDLTISEVAAQIERMISPLNDAHTYIRLNFADMHYMKHAPEHNEDTLVAVNGQSLDEMADEYAEFFSSEAHAWTRERLEGYVGTLEGLHYLGIPTDVPITYTYDTKNGPVDITVSETDFLPWSEYSQIPGAAEQSATDFVGYEIYPEQSLAVLRLDVCNNNATYKSTVNEMFTEVKERGIRNVAVDLRENGGGDSAVATTFMQYLDRNTYNAPGTHWRWGPIMLDTPVESYQNEKVEELAFDGNVYVLTSPQTFSSAMLFAEYLQDNGLAQVIGESPGNDPNGYGEITWLTLPNSNLMAQISTKKFDRISGESGFIEPDTACPADEALDTLMKQLSA